MAKRIEPRSKKPDWLPKYCYVGRSAYEFKPKGTKKTIRLGRLSDPADVIIAEYKRHCKEINTAIVYVADLIDAFFDSPDFMQLAESTQHDYRKKNAKRLLPVFGEMYIDDLKPVHIRQYLDMRGQKSVTQANRETAFLSRVYSWGYERGYCSTNPVKGVRKFSEKPRDRYITDAEYQAVYEAGCNYVKKAMEISYCCAARRGDVLALTKSQLLQEGIFIKQGKTGKKQIKLWSQRLKDAIALHLPGRQTKYVMHNRDGGQLSENTFRHQWDRARKKAMKDNPLLDFDFTFHDIKAKSISDYQGLDKQRFSGHKTASQVATYDRKVEIVPTHK